MTNLIGLAALGELPTALKVRDSLPCSTCPSSMWTTARATADDIAKRGLPAESLHCYCLLKHDFTWDAGDKRLTRCSVHQVRQAG